MTHKPGLIFMFLFLFIAAAFAETIAEIRCIFTEGEVLIGTNGDWNQLEPGYSTNSEESLRITGGGIASFNMNGRHVTVSSSGTYNIGDIAGEIPQRQRVSALDSFLIKLKVILNGQEEVNPTEALGLRAAEVEDTGFEWNDVDEEDFEYALELLESDDPEEAGYILEDLLLFGNPYLTDEYRFYLAYALLLQNRAAEALAQLHRIEDAMDFDFYEGYLVLLGRLSYEGLDDKSSREAWKTYLEEFPEGPAGEEARIYLQKL